VTCRGGMTWWDDYLIVGCYDYKENIDEVSHSLPYLESTAIILHELKIYDKI